MTISSDLWADGVPSELVMELGATSKVSDERQLLGKRDLNPSSSTQFHVNISNKCPEPGEGSQVSSRALKEQHEGTPATPASE